jgi:hypothetical protein
MQFIGYRPIQYRHKVHHLSLGLLLRQSFFKNIIPNMIFLNIGYGYPYFLNFFGPHAIIRG